jgi:hypothetical protein
MKRLSWINVALGLWLVAIGAGLAHLAGKAVVEDITAGLFISVSALWATYAFDTTISEAASWTVVIAGAWTAIAPFVLGYQAHRLAATNDVLVGVSVFLLGIANVTLKTRRSGIQQTN